MKPLGVKDLTGQVFGRWTVIAYSHKSNNKAKDSYWICQCIDGTEKAVAASSLRKGMSTSCGCLKKDSPGPNTKHGLSAKRIYRCYQGMIQRTTNPNYENLVKNYQDRKIEVCQEWLDSFETFAAWAFANGYKDNLTLERQNNAKGYCPENCTWADMKTQSRNRQSSKWVHVEGFGDYVLVEALEKFCVVVESTFRYRLKQGWTVTEALLTPPANPGNRKLGKRSKRK